MFNIQQIIHQGIFIIVYSLHCLYNKSILNCTKKPEIALQIVLLQNYEN